MTLEQFRETALSFADAEERAHMGHPDFRVAGKIFATLQPAKGLGMVQLPPERQQTYLQLAPAAFVPAAGAWGRNGSTLVHLHLADAEIVREAMELAWRNAQAKAGRKAGSKAPQRLRKVPRSSS